MTVSRDPSTRGEWILLALAVLAQGSCSRSAYLQSLSAGRTGCAPGDVTISDEQTRFQGRNWTATCAKKRYQCAINGLGYGAVVACTRMDDEPSTAATPARVPMPEQPTTTTASFTAVGGFKFGSDLEAARKACADASLVVRDLGEGRLACSGAPEDIGIPVTSVVETCGGRVCGLELDANPDGARWAGVVDRYVTVRRALERKYGDNERTTTDPLEDCSDEVKACFARGRVSMSATWTFEEGSKLSLHASGGKPGANSELVLRYRKPGTHGGDARPTPAAPAAAGSAAPTAGEAQPQDGFDTVFLTSGGRLRGTVFEEDPKAGVGIKLPDGNTRRIKAEEVKKVVYHGQ